MLTATNAMVDEVNTNMLRELPQEALNTYHNVDEVDANTPDEKSDLACGLIELADAIWHASA